MKDSRGCSFLSFLCCLLFTFPSLTHATPAFIQAAQEGRLDLIQELLKNPKENVNDQDEQGRTALMVASENGHLQIVQRLLEKNADLRLIDRQGRTALDWARIQGHSAILQLLDEKWESSKTLHPGNPPWAKDSPLWESDQRILKNPEDRKVEKKISGAQEGEENPIEGGARLIELKPQDLGYQFVKTYFEQSQKESAQHGLNGLSAFQIQKVQLIDNPLYEKLFLEAAQVLRQRQGNMAFDPHADQTADRELRKKVFDFFSDKSNPYSPSDHSCTFIPVWHGTKKEVLPSILKTGFANLAKTDVGYYGKGIYGSTNAEYVKRVYSGGYHKGVLLLNWAAVYSAYPVVGKQDIEDLKGKGNRENYDGHYIAVKPRNPFAHLRRTEGTYFPLTQVDEQPSYDELVVFDGSHVLARYRVEIERTIPELQTAKDYFDWAKTLADDEKVRLPSSEVVDKATLFQKALQLSTQLQTPRGSSVWKIFSLGKPEKAEEDLEDFISGIKDELGGLLLRKEEATPEELKEAKKYFEEAIAPGNKSRTSLASPYFHLAQVLVRLKNTHSSLERPRTGHLPARKSEPMSIEEVASQTVALDEKKPHPEYLLFLASLKSRDLQISLEEQEAFQLIQKALHLDSGFPQAYDLLGQLLYANEKVSVVTLKKPVTQEGQSPETETLTLTARECFKKAIALDEDYYPAYVHLGEYLRRNEKPGTKVKLEFPVDQELTARGLFEYAIEKNPQCSLGYARLAQGVSGDLVELNRSKTRDFLRKFFKKQQSEALPSMSAQDLGELAYCLDKRNSISSIAFASTLGKEEKRLPDGVSIGAKELCKTAYLMASGQQPDLLPQPATLPEVYLALAHTLGPEDKLELTEISSAGRQTQKWGQKELWEKALELQPDCKEAVLLLSRRVIPQESQFQQGSRDEVDLKKIQETLVGLFKYYPEDALILDQLGLSLKDKSSILEVEGNPFSKTKLFEKAFRADPTNTEIYGHLATLGEVSVTSLIDRLRGQSEREVDADLAMKQGFDLYVPVKATEVDLNENPEPEEKNCFDLAEKVNHFLEEPKPPFLLLQGKAGSSKSLFGRRLEEQLWKKYKTHPDSSPLPLFISLPQIAHFEKELIEQALERKGIEKTYLHLLKSSKFVFILDGLDEVGKKILELDEKGRSFLTRHELNTPGGWQGKILVSSRLGYLNKEDTRFLASSLEAQDEVLRVFIVPFSPERIRDYIQNYADSAYNTAHWSREKYQETLNSFQGQGLEELIKEPFLLQLILRVLPELEAKYHPKEKKTTTKTEEATPPSQVSTVKLTRYQLYESFMEGWFQKEAKRLRGAHQLRGWDDKLLDELTAQKIMDEYATDLGFALFLEDKQMIDFTPSDDLKPKPVISDRLVNRSDEEVLYENEEVKKGWGRFFESSNKKERRKLKIGFKGCPLKKISDGKYMFLHKSFQEYFAARKILQEILQFKTQEEFLHVVKTRWGELALNRKNLNSDLSVLNFIADHFSMTQGRGRTGSVVGDLPRDSSLDFQSRLWKIIEASKEHPESRDLAAGNAATLFNRVKMNFSGKDLRGVNLSGADLSGGILDGTNLEKAILRGVNFKGAWLRGASLKESDMSNVGFGELASLFFPGNVNFSTYSVDGKLFAVAEGKTIHLFTVKENSFELRESLKGHTGSVYSIAFSSNGNSLVSGGSDKTVRLWKLGGEKVELAQTLEGHTGRITSVAWSFDGKSFASSSEDKTIRLWKLEGERVGEPQTLEGHTDCVTSVVFSPKGQILASAGGTLDKTVRLWKLEEGKAEPLQTLEGHQGPVQSVVFSPDGQILASAGGVLSKDYDTKVYLWKLEGEKWESAQPPLEGHTSSITSLMFSPNGQILVSGSVDKTIRLWKLEAGKAEFVQSLEGHAGFVKSLAFSLDSQTLASAGSYDHSVRLWSLQEGKAARAQTVEGHTQKVTSVTFSRDGQFLASGSEDKTVRLWKLEGGKAEPLQNLKNQGAISSVAFSSDGQLLASGSLNETLLLWKREGEKVVEPQILKGHEDPIRSVAFSPDGQLLALAGGDYYNALSFWKLDGGKVELFPTNKKTYKNSANSLMFSPDSQLLASGHLDKTVRLWKLEGGKAELVQTLEGHDGPIQSVMFTPEGAWLASASVDKTIRLWKLEGGKAELFQTLEGHTDSVNSVTFSGNAQYLASGSDDSSIRIWEGKGSKASFMTQTPFKIYSLAYSSVPDRLFLATAGDDCSVRLWEQSDERLTLLWSSCQTLLWVEKADITQSQLSSQNVALLTQRGAIDEIRQEASAAQGGVSQVDSNIIIPFVQKEGEERVPSAFAALGDMYQTLGLIWSGVAPNSMNHYDAEKFCQGLGEEVRLPTAEEWGALGKLMSPGGIFNPDLLPGTRGKYFWSSSVLPNRSDYAFRFSGAGGLVCYNDRYRNRSVRCVLPAVAWGF